MSDESKILQLANKLESLLREYLDCSFTDFGVKANDNLLSGDWKSPINFALGHKYMASSNNALVKDKINFFLGNELKGLNISDIVAQYDYYGFKSDGEALDYIDKTIDCLEQFLNNHY